MTMNCAEFERHLERLMDGDGGEPLDREAQRHLEICSRCRELEALALGEPVTTDEGADPGIAAAIIGRTSGPACGAAAEHLGDLADGRLQGLDLDLVRIHLAHCSECAELAVAMQQLARQLPSMAEVDPGPGFTARVLRATSEAGARSGSPWGARLRWAGLLLRPRFALEAAYVGALVLWLLFGTGISPLRGIPAQALAAARSGGELLIDYAQPAGDLVRATRGKIVAGTRPVKADWSSRMAGAGEATLSLGKHGVQAVRATIRGDFDQGTAHWELMKGDLRSIWTSLSGRGAATGPRATEA